MGKLTVTDWEEMYKAFVFGTQKDGVLEFPTFEELAKQYGVTVYDIKRRAGIEGWVKEREAYLRERKIRAEQKLVEQFANDIAELNKDIISSVRILVEKIKNKIFELDEHSVKTYDFVNLANAIKNIKDIEKSIIGTDSEAPAPMVSVVINDGTDLATVLSKMLKLQEEVYEEIDAEVKD